MDKITFRTLSGVDLSVLHAIWLRAFSDYVVSMQCSEEQFRNRLVREGCDYNASVGIFAGGEIVGFTFNSIGVWDGVPTAYDAGTAIAPEFRGRHLGEELFQFMFPLLKERGAEQYLLEVITTNTPAVNLYRKLGFRTTRELGSPVLAGGVTTLSHRNNSSVSIREISLPEPGVAEGF